MGIFDRSIENAKRAIKEKGQVVIWRTLVDELSIDPNKPWLPSASIPVENSVSIVFLPLSKENREFLRYLKETSIPTGSLSGLMGAVSFEPKIKDVVIRDNKELVVLNFDKISPNGNAILYIVEFGT